MNKKSIEAELVRIAQEHISAMEGRPDLRPHNSDSADFFEVSVWELRSALLAAYELGRQQATKTK